MAAKFGTSGLRGLVEELLDGTGERHIIGFANHLLEAGQVSLGDKVYIGQDFRPSSPEIAEQTADGLVKTGLVPVHCRDLPTPALAYYAMNRGSASIMITGSHIPADRNGIKFYLPSGEIAKFNEQAISRNAAKVEMNQLGAVNRPEPANEKDAAIDEYIARYDGFLAKDALDGTRLGVYEHSSVARDLLKTILSGFGAEVTSLERSDNFIPVDTEAVSEETCEKLLIWAKEYNLDAIISTDGDGDRPLLAGENGICVKGDVLGLITAKVIGADRVITPVSSSSGIESAQNADVARTRIGSPFVIEKIENAIVEGANSIAAFEANGGFLLGSNIKVGACELAALPTRDCVLPVLAVLSAAKAGGFSVSELVSSLKLPVTESGRIENLPTEISGKLISELKEDGAKREAFFKKFGVVSGIDVTDGLRVKLDNGSIIHLRPSGNAPEMRCYVEADSVEKAQKLLEAGIDHIRQELRL